MKLNRLSGKCPTRQRKSLSVKREDYERKAQLHKSGVGKITAKQENHKEGEKKNKESKVRV